MSSTRPKAFLQMASSASGSVGDVEDVVVDDVLVLVNRKQS